MIKLVRGIANAEFLSYGPQKVKKSQKMPVIVKKIYIKCGSIFISCKGIKAYKGITEQKKISCILEFLKFGPIFYGLQRGRKCLLMFFVTLSLRGASQLSTRQMVFR
jgi:hypothetical protein